MDIVTIDFETYYSRKEGYTLSKMTTDAYVRDARFDMIGAGVAINDAPPRWFGHKDFKAWAATWNWDETACLAHHAHFDGFVLSHHYGIRPKWWYDTLSMARELHGVDVGGSLKLLAPHYGLGEKGETVLLADGHRWPDWSAEWHAYGDYCCNDVILTLELFKRMFPQMSISSLRGINKMVRMFTEPRLLVNESYLSEFVAWEEKRKRDILEGLGTPDEQKKLLMSNDKFAAKLQALGVEVPTKKSAAKSKKAGTDVYTWALAKSDQQFTALLDYTGDNEAEVRALVEARLATKSTINETRAKRLLAAGKGGRPVPVYLKWYAAHTGRAGGGDGMNFQNFERTDEDNPRKGALRHSLIAPPNHSLVVVDSAQIEARVLAWLAGETGLLEALRRNDASGGDLYCDVGAEFFGRPVVPGSVERRISKALTLGLGFSMGWKKCAQELLRGMLGAKPVQFTATDAATFGVDVGDFAKIHGDEIRKIPHTLDHQSMVVHCAVTDRFVRIYRKKNSRIAQLWREAGNLLPWLAAENDAGTRRFGPGDCLEIGPGKIRLPDGSSLRYPGLECRDGDWSYSGRKGARVHIYGGLLVENMVQALARVIVFGQVDAISE